MSYSDSKLDLTFPLLACGIILTVAAAYPLLETGYWWHLAVGRLIDTWSAIPVTNQFAYTLDKDAPFFAQHWLTDWGLYELYRAGSLHLHLTVRNMLIAGSGAWLVWMTTHRHSRLPSLLAGTVSGLYLLTLGASSLALVGLVSFVLIASIEYHFRWLETYYPLTFIPVTALAANTFEAWLVPVTFVWALAVVKLTRHYAQNRLTPKAASIWMGAAIGSFLAVGVNPRGLEIFRFNFTGIHPFELAIVDGPGFAVWLCLLILSGWTLIRYRSSISGERAALLALAAIWSVTELQTLRAPAIFPFALFTALAETPLFTTSIASRFPDSRLSALQMEEAPLWMLVPLLAVGLAVQPVFRTGTTFLRTTSPIDLRKNPPLQSVVGSDLPVTHAQILEKIASPRRLFHDRSIGGLLAFLSTDPRFPRRVLFTTKHREPKHIRRLYRLLSRGEAWRGVFQQYDIETAVLNRNTQSELLSKIRQHPEWYIAHRDNSYVLAMKKDTPVDRELGVESGESGVGNGE